MTALRFAERPVCPSFFSSFSFFWLTASLGFVLRFLGAHAERVYSPPSTRPLLRWRPHARSVFQSGVTMVTDRILVVSVGFCFWLPGGVCSHSAFTMDVVVALPGISAVLPALRSVRQFILAAGEAAFRALGVLLLLVFRGWFLYVQRRLLVSLTGGGTLFGARAWLPFCTVFGTRCLSMFPWVPM
mgnify:CR=1 FL=1